MKEPVFVDLTNPFLPLQQLEEPEDVILKAEVLSFGPIAVEELKVRNQEAQEVILVKIQEKFTVSQEICKVMEAWSEDAPPV